MTHYFIADTHFGDDNVRRFFGRPFRSTDEMDRAMIAGCSAIDPQDDLWVVGDFAACETQELRARASFAFESLPGRKHLIRGNHDCDWVCTSLGWESLHDLIEFEAEGRRLVLCHYPLVTWNGVRDGALQIFGHVHDRWPGAQGQVNVGVDLWQFKPVDLTQIEIAALTMPPSPLQAVVEGYGD